MTTAMLSNVRHRPIYTIADIAEACGPGWTALRIRALLANKKVPISKEGNKHYVFLSSIESHCPELAASIIEAKRLTELSGVRVVAVYTCAQIARMCGGGEWNNDRVRRMLRHHNVPKWLNGNKYYIFLSSLQEVFPELWNSLLQARASVDDDDDDDDPVESAPVALGRRARVDPDRVGPYARPKRPDSRHVVDGRR